MDPMNLRDLERRSWRTTLRGGLTEILFGILSLGGAASLTEYRIFETDRFQTDVRKIARSGQGGLEEKLRTYVYPQLRQRPHFGPHIRKLKNWKPETWRYRVGSWRFLYEIDEDDAVVLMTGAEHRSSAYR